MEKLIVYKKLEEAPKIAGFPVAQFYALFAGAVMWSVAVHFVVQWIFGVESAWWAIAAFSISMTLMILAQIFLRRILGDPSAWFVYRTTPKGVDVEEIPTKWHE